MAEFSGRVILITGAGSGIGRATSIKLSSLGATLVLTDINEATAEETWRQCKAAGAVNVSVRAVDVRSVKQCDDILEAVMAKHGALHHLFNCAGVNPTQIATEAVTDQYWDTLMDTNLKGTFNMTRAALPHLQSGASIVNTSSLCGLYPTAGLAVYCATKYAVIGFSKCVALEVGARGIRVNIIAPGQIDTPTNASVVAGPEVVQRAAERCGLKRIGTPDEVADVVAFLFSDKSRYMNGSVVEVDGGIGVSV